MSASNWKPCGCGCRGYNLEVAPQYYWAEPNGDNFTIYSGHCATGAFVGYRPNLEEAELAAKEHAARRAA